VSCQLKIGPDGYYRKYGDFVVGLDYTIEIKIKVVNLSVEEGRPKNLKEFDNRFNRFLSEFMPSIAEVRE